jgi:hypothetical protein
LIGVDYYMEALKSHSESESDLESDDWILIEQSVKRPPLTAADMEANHIIAMGWDDMLRYCLQTRCSAAKGKECSVEKLISIKK